jgi:hypothetical protein
MWENLREPVPKVFKSKVIKPKVKSKINMDILIPILKRLDIAPVLEKIKS